MSETNAQEPTMEEILASIRRIISEDDAPAAEPPAPEPAAAAPEPRPAPAPMPAAPPLSAAPPPTPAPPAPPPAPEEEVLELTEPFDPPAPSAPAPVRAQTYQETLGDLDVFSEQAASPASAEPSALAFEHEPLVGSYAAETTAGHFGALARSVAMPKEGRTLEDVVRELLKPLLADWLDQHLSGIVEARVQAEVERISRRADY